MSNLCFYGKINDEWVPRVFMEGWMINEFLEFDGNINDKWVPRVCMGG
jgi:hypothetical protein